MFLKEKGVKHKFSAPYHPATNGQVERYVQSMKKGLKRLPLEGKNSDIELKAQNFLIHYHKTVHSTTGLSPAVLAFKRDIRTRIDLIRPIPKQEIDSGETIAKKIFSVGETVRFQNYDKTAMWKFEKIIRREGTLHYWIFSEGKRLKDISNSEN